MFTFTDINGTAFSVSPDEPVVIYADPADANRSFIVLSDGTRLHLAQTKATTVAQVDKKFASVAATASGNNTIVSAVTDKKIRVLGYMLTADAAGGGIDGRFRTGAAGAFLTGPMFLEKGVISTYAGNTEAPAFETVAGDALILNLSAAKNISGHIVYIEV